jgi:alkylresorcinol/alkylpyrone synthase
LASRLGLRPDVKRVPLFGLGCVAGAAGVARMHDYLLAVPDQVGVLLAVELCSLTLQRDDSTVANLLAASLFGGGAAGSGSRTRRWATAEL